MNKKFNQTNSKKAWVKPSLLAYGTVQSMTEAKPAPIGSSSKSISCPSGYVKVGKKCVHHKNLV